MMDRRRFLAGIAASTLISQSFGQRRTGPDIIAPQASLVPPAPASSPNYWCTWAAQNYMYGHGLASLDPVILEGDSGSNLAHDAMTEQTLFGAQGWATTFHPKVRSELFLLLDDGWQAGGSSTFVLDSKKFPGFTGTPLERLTKLNRAVLDAGWRGTALWCRNPPGGETDRRLEALSKDAGIAYWKIDMGDPGFELVQLRDEQRIPLLLEHVHGEYPMNGDWKKDGRFGPQAWDSRRVQILSHTDIYRTYDVTSILSLPTTLDRLAELLRGTEGRPEVHGLLNVEDEVYVAAVMGCTMGIMRHPLMGLRPGPDYDLFFNGVRQPKRRMDEVVRAVRWQRIAPPFAAGIGRVQVSDEIITDGWTFEPGQTWQHEILHETVRQGAPARIARNLSLPNVKCSGDAPFVFAARFPNGAVAIGAQERTRTEKAWYMPECDVTLHAGDAAGPFGVFGRFGSLTLVFDGPREGKRLLAQDLAGDEAVDISSQVKFSGRSVTIPGEVLLLVGLGHATEYDNSSPGCVLAIV
jgi:hypothetical protein